MTITVMSLSELFWQLFSFLLFSLVFSTARKHVTTSSPISSLPLALLRHIFDYLGDNDEETEAEEPDRWLAHNHIDRHARNRAQLHSLSLVSRAWNRAATPLLWRNLVLDAERCDPDAVMDLLEDDEGERMHEYGPLARSVWIRERENAIFRVEPWVVNVITTQCPNVEEIRLCLVRSVGTSAGERRAPVPLNWFAASLQRLRSVHVCGYEDRPLEEGKGDYTGEEGAPNDEYHAGHDTPAGRDSALVASVKMGGPRLESLVVLWTYNCAPPREVYEAVCLHCPNIRRFSLGHEAEPGGYPGDDALQLLACSCPMLEEVTLSLGVVSTQGIRAISTLARLRHLTLYLEEEASPAAEMRDALLSIPLGCPRLRVVHISLCRSFNGTLLDAFLRCCPELRAFWVKGFDNDAVADDPVLRGPQFCGCVEMGESGLWVFRWPRHPPVGEGG